MKTLTKILGFAVAALIVVALGFYFIEVYAPLPANPTLSAAIQHDRLLSSASLIDPPILAALTLGRGTEKYSSPIASSSPRPFPSLSSASAARSPQQRFRNRWRGFKPLDSARR